MPLLSSSNIGSKEVKRFQSTPLNTLVGMTWGVGYFVKGLNPHTPTNTALNLYLPSWHMFSSNIYLGNSRKTCSSQRFPRFCIWLCW